MRTLALAALLAAGCAQEPRYVDPLVQMGLADSLNHWYADSVVAPRAAMNRALAAQAFDPGPAVPDSGILWLRFRVPTTDNRGTCEAPQPDSAYASDALWARVFRSRRVYDGSTVYDETAADSFPVRRGETVTWWKRVPCDSFDVNVRLFKGATGGCRKYLLGQVVTPSTPPTPVLLQP